MASIPEYAFDIEKMPIEYKPPRGSPSDESSFLLYYRVSKKEEGSWQEITYNDFFRIIYGENEDSKRSDSFSPKDAEPKFMDGVVYSTSLIRGIFECVKYCTEQTERRIIDGMDTFNWNSLHKYKRCVNFWCRIPGIYYQQVPLVRAHCNLQEYPVPAYVNFDVCCSRPKKLSKVVTKVVY